MPDIIAINNLGKFRMFGSAEVFAGNDRTLCGNFTDFAGFDQQVFRPFNYWLVSNFNYADLNLRNRIAHTGSAASICFGSSFPGESYDCRSNKLVVLQWRHKGKYFALVIEHTVKKRWRMSLRAGAPQEITVFKEGSLMPFSAP